MNQDSSSDYDDSSEEKIMIYCDIPLTFVVASFHNEYQSSYIFEKANSNKTYNFSNPPQSVSIILHLPILRHDSFSYLYCTNTFVFFV